ncbi:MAG: haloacid dehalogenase-like hydrolase [Butyricicoccus sp.]|nr:haloacid dehalogenase-like hydrolase [Butyricicoccus sp.]
MNVFDFDNTIYRGESTIDFFRFCLRKKPSMIRYLPAILWQLLRYKCGVIPAEGIIARGERVLRCFLQEIRDIDALVKEFWDRNEHKIKEQFRAMLCEDDLILSGSCEILLEEICRRLGVQNFLGTRVDLDTCHVEFLCYHENKVKAFLENYPTETIQRFYSDSIHDLPIARLADSAFRVRGDRVIPWIETA